MHTERSRKSSRVSLDVPRPIRLTLNDLPQNAIDEILIRLPIKAAVGTSLISRFWRHRWKSIPDLVFLDLPDNFVTHALLLHSGLLRTFKFIGLISPSVDCWLLALSSRAADSLQTLILSFPRDRVKYDLHSAAFSFRHLTRVLFRNCTLNPPCDFPGFKHLRSIHLEQVSFPNGSQLSSLLSASPCLKTVRLLKVVGKGCLKICGPSIQSLCYKEVDFDDFALGSCPLLQHADIRLPLTESSQSYDGDDSDEDQWIVLGRRGAESLATHGVPWRTPIYFDSLSVMSLGIDFTDMRSASAAVYLLRSCPNLEELEIKSYFRNEFEIEAAEDIWDAQRHVNLFPKLRIVKMLRILSEESELELARLILETSQVLETLVIKVGDGSVDGTGSAIIKLLAFRRASNRAQILCTF